MNEKVDKGQKIFYYKVKENRLKRESLQKKKKYNGRTHSEST